jgi:hypothetical protein
MCQNAQCAKAETCYRHRAIPNEHWQTFSNFKPDGEGGCEYYWSIEGYTQLRPFLKDVK